MENIKKLSIVIPVYNEEKTIRMILEKIFDVDFGIVKIEVIVVNDGSKDGTLKEINELKKKFPIKLVSYKNNRGKGGALREGFKKITGDVVTIQDGDLEYDPRDFLKMLKMMSKPGVKVVYGSRRLNNENVQYSALSFYVGGLLLTHVLNILYGGNITDIMTCYKMFDNKLLESLKLRSNRFEFCSEVTAKLLKKGEKIYEVPISYYPRKVIQGKKIKNKDFFEVLWTLVKYRFSS